MTDGEWVGVSDFAACMGISVAYVYILVNTGKVTRKRVIDMTEEEYKKFGRGRYNNSTYAYWLPDDLNNIMVGRGRKKR